MIIENEGYRTVHRFCSYVATADGAGTKYHIVSQARHSQEKESLVIPS